MKKIHLIFAAAILSAVLAGCNFSGTNQVTEDTTPPAKVTNLEVTTGNTCVLISWSNPADEDFYGTELSVLKGTETCSTVVVLKETHQNLFSNLENDVEYTFSASTLDKSLNKSEAVVVKAIPAAPVVPPEPAVVVEDASDFAAETTESKKVSLTWTKPASDFFVYQLVYYESAKPEEAVSLILDKSEESYTAKKLTNDIEYTFKLTVLDSSLNMSAGVTKTCTPVKPVDYVAPLISESRTESLDYIFNTETLGQTEITITREEWNQMLEYINMNPKNETYVHADYKFTKGDKTWSVKDVGLRIRGNSSRKAPQTDAGNYQQAHFKISLEEWREDGEEVKISNCLKSVMLKRFKDDPTYSREVFGYNMFRENGIWTAPRSAYTTLKISIIDSSGNDDESTEEIPYGVYEMIEQVDKQFLKERESDGKLSSNTGNLWKCTYPASFANYTDSSCFGVENIQLDENLSARYAYDLKTNKETAAAQISAFRKWMKELNQLETTGAIKAWYEKNMDVDLFLKTYAINVILGMWDDYWVNQNNFYFYFDTDGKAYFIPYDYDNILGVNNCGVNSGTQNPLKWGSLDDGSRPLVQKLLSVDEYMSKYKQYLKEFSDSESWFDYSKSKPRIEAWQNLIKDYISSDKLQYSDTYSSFDDFPASWSVPYVQYKLLSGDLTDNYFLIRQKVIAAAVSDTGISVTLNAGDGAFAYDDGNGYKSESSVTFTTDSVVSVTDIIDSYNYFNPEYYGYKFVCWKDESGNTVKEDTPLYESCVLTAQWEELAKLNITYYDNSGNVLLTLNNILEGQEVESLFDSTGTAYPSFDDDRIFYYWRTDSGDYAETVSAEATQFYPASVKRNSLPVIYDKTVPNQVTVSCSVDNFYFDEIWLNRRNSDKPSELTKDSITAVYIRGNFNGNGCWSESSQIPLSYNEETGLWQTTVAIENEYRTDNVFKFVVDWDTDGDNIADDYSWVDYWRLNINLPSKFLFRWDSDDVNDYKYSIPEFIKLQKKM